jgi:hypothetical protein
MSKEQMKKDLENRTREKLKLLTIDTIELYKTGGLSPRDAMATITSEMTYIVIQMLTATTRITPEKFGQLMQETYKAIYEKEKEDDDDVQIIEVQLLRPNVTPEILGCIPDFLDLRDPRPAREQFNENYAHGGGWHPMKGWQLLKDNSIYYTGSLGESDNEPPYKPLAQTKFRNELIVIYDHAWVAIIQPDRTFEVSRMD